MTITDDQLHAAGRQLLNLSYETWNFGDSVAFEAMIALSARSGRPDYLQFARGYFRAWATRALPYRHLDLTAPGRAMVSAYEATGDSHVLEAALRLADHLVARRRMGDVFATWESSPLMHAYGPETLDARGSALLANPPAGVFVDCLHFDPPFLTALGRTAGREDLLEEGVRQALGYVALLQTSSGLFDHFILERVPGRFGPGWGRGQGWALLGLLDVLDVLDLLGGSPHRAAPEISHAAARLATRMLELQRPDGHWNAVVDDTDGDVESSTAAFMAHGLRRAARRGLLDNDRAYNVINAADLAVQRSTSPDGLLKGVSAAVMACTEPTHYAHVPRGFAVPWGQGPLVLALLDAAEKDA